ncbi:MAG: Bacillopeptidase F precursor [Bacteroidetes bacterium ADurb.Bin041]|nr:MAG: Bacillopeptidase F precursor [Bacteroidetes bacterium ADurb.Bin041]
MMQQAVLEGYVRDSVTNQPIEGATITLTERVTITTDVNGFYHYGFWNNTTVDLTAQKHSYYSQTVTNIVLTMGTTVTQNFNLVPLPRVTVSGIVTANDYPTGLVGATVKISGTENYETTTGTGGAFNISNVLGSADTLSYALTVEKEGYQTYISALNVATTNVNVGTINLTEYLWTPYNLVATHSGNNVSLTWEPAGVPNYYFCDFESDNGGWVSSGYGDWQWGHYNLANYMDIDTYTDTPPQSAHSGTGMWGTVLEGGYSNCNTWSYLRKTFDLSNFSNPVLSFWHYMNGYNTWDYGLIKVNGTTVWGNSSSAVFMPWQELTINLSAYANMNSVEISFEWFATATVSYAGWYIDDIYIGPASRNIVATQFASRSSGDRSFQNYSVYRFLTADEGTPSNWTLLQTGVADTTYMDTTFGTQPGGKYKWAVKANYSGSLQSNAIISNHLGKLAKPQNVVATKVGTTVQLSWTADPGADYYVIYAASDPYGTFTVLDYENTTSYTISAPLAKQFFKIASADGTMPIAKEIEPPAKSKK